MRSRATGERDHVEQLTANTGLLEIPAADRKGLSPEAIGTLATALAFTPLVAHRLFELLAGQVDGRSTAMVLLHTLPPLAMLGAALAIWRRVGPLPDATRRAAGRAGLAVAAGLLLGSGAALANLLTVLAQSPHHAVVATTSQVLDSLIPWFAGPAGYAASLDAGAAALILHIALLAPIAEEAAFRGLIYRQLRQRISPVWATVISATIFAVMHGNLHQALWAFGLGVVTAIAYERTGSLLAPILVHALFNAVPVAVVVARSKPDDTGPIWLVLSVVAFIFTLAAQRVAREGDERERLAAA
ncbi:MAG: CPBP family intramembrane metalloprotease [Myxococcales bacterium]|nr:CPBP family intramembrane metalloprotease [Myxococcales bacterium]